MSASREVNPPCDECSAETVHASDPSAGWLECPSCGHVQGVRHTPPGRGRFELSVWVTDSWPDCACKGGTPAALEHSATICSVVPAFLFDAIDADRPLTVDELAAVNAAIRVAGRRCSRVRPHVRTPLEVGMVEALVAAGREQRHRPPA